MLRGWVAGAARAHMQLQGQCEEPLPDDEARGTGLEAEAPPRLQMVMASSAVGAGAEAVPAAAATAAAAASTLQHAIDEHGDWRCVLSGRNLRGRKHRAERWAVVGGGTGA